MRLCSALGPDVKGGPTFHVGKAADRLPLLLQVSNVVLVILQRQVLKPGGQERTCEGGREQGWAQSAGNWGDLGRVGAATGAARRPPTYSSSQLR